MLQIRFADHISDVRSLQVMAFAKMDVSKDVLIEKGEARAPWPAAIVRRDHTFCFSDLHRELHPCDADGKGCEKFVCVGDQSRVQTGDQRSGPISNDPIIVQ